MNNLTNIDRLFTDQYSGLLDIQKQVYEKLKVYKYDLNDTEITDAVIARMSAFWAYHVPYNKNLLDRHSNPVAADYFTESCLMFIKAYFNGKYIVKSEAQIKISSNKRKHIKPDISIWKKDKLIAVIEIKVSNGWKGKHIYSHLSERENQIKSLFPDIFFGVIAFWNFFDTNNNEWNKKYVGLKWYNEKEGHPVTGASIENIIKSIENYANETTNQHEK